jgi:hypothetical protein
MPIVPSNGEILRRKKTAISVQRIFGVAPTAPNGGLIQCLSQSHYKEMTMFDMNLPQNLGVLPVQHETVPVDALQSVGQAAGGGPCSPQSLAATGAILPTLLVSLVSICDQSPIFPSIGQGNGGGPYPPPK